MFVCCALSEIVITLKKSRHFARPLAKVIANELDELSMYFQYYIK